MKRSKSEIESLLIQNRRLVRQIARRCFPEHGRDQDLLQCGIIGLWEAAKTWEPKISKFSTYAKHCIRNNMFDYIRSDNKAPIPFEHLEEQETDCEDDTIDRMDLLERIKAAWPPNSRERYLLIALSNGASMLSVAAALGVQVHTARKIAERAIKGIQQKQI